MASVPLKNIPQKLGDAVCPLHRIRVPLRRRLAREPPPTPPVRWQSNKSRIFWVAAWSVGDQILDGNSPVSLAQHDSFGIGGEEMNHHAVASILFGLSFGGALANGFQLELVVWSEGVW